MGESDVQMTMPEDITALWFRTAKTVAQLRPELYKMEGRLVPNRPGYVVRTAWFVFEGRLARVSVTMPQGEDFHAPLAAAMEAEYRRLLGGGES
jgi:hypothetical protein